MKVKVGQIVVNPLQPRKVFDDEELGELAASIRQYGIILPIPVIRLNGNGTYQLIDGERRWRAAQMAGLEEVPVEVREADDIELLEIALVANLHRSDLNPMEEAEAYRDLIEAGISEDVICERMGVRKRRVRNRLKMLELDEPIRALIAKRKLAPSEKIAKALLSIPDKRVRLEVAKHATRPGMTVGMIQAKCRKARVQLGIEDDPKSPPAVRYAQKKTGQRVVPIWDYLVKMQAVPTWTNVKIAAEKSCRQCALYQVASESTCSECPAIFIVANMIEASQEKK